MEGTQLKNLRMFENLCGKEFNGIVLTTTMWDEVSEELGAERESALKDEYWKSLIERGSSVKRFLSTQQSAFEILMPILEEVDRRSVLLLQNEMNDLQLQLKDTSAGKTLHIELGELVARHQDVLRRMRDPIDDADQFQLLMEEHQRVSVQLQRASEDMRRMKIPRRRRIKGFDWRSIFRLVTCLRFTVTNIDAWLSVAFLRSRRRRMRETGKVKTRKEGSTPGEIVYSKRVRGAEASSCG